MNALIDHIETVSAALKGYGYVHPGGNGRVIVLEPPYQLPSGMDLRGIAGVVLKREQNLEIKAMLDNMSDEEKDILHKQAGRNKAGQLIQNPPMGPRPPASFDLPEPLRGEIETLSNIFQRLTGAQENVIWFPRTPAPQFHIDGTMTKNPVWRLTYAFSGAQTEWHRHIKTNETPVLKQGFVGFPILSENENGVNNIDYFASEGALMFLCHSDNGLFHRTPLGIYDKRFVVTMDAGAPKRENCTASCPFPCRTFN